MDTATSQYQIIEQIARERLGKAWSQLTEAEKALVLRMAKRLMELRTASFGRALTDAEQATLNGMEKGLVAIGTGFALSTLETIVQGVLEHIARNLPAIGGAVSKMLD